MDQPTNPRRNRVSFECGMGNLGSIMDLLVKHIGKPTAVPVNDDRYKITFLAMLSDCLRVLDLIQDNIEKLTVLPEDVNVVSEAARPYQAKLRPVYTVPAHVQVKRIPMKRKYTRGGGKASQKTTGLAILSAFRTKSIAHNPDFADALQEAGFQATTVSSIVNELLREGAMIRCGHGAYRLPTAEDTVQKAVDDPDGPPSDVPSGNESAPR